VSKKKVLVYLFDSVSPGCFVQRQLGLHSLLDLFLNQDYYFRDPKKYFPLKDTSYDLSFQVVSQSLNPAEISAFKNSDYANVILWPLSQWPQNLSDCAEKLETLLQADTGILNMGVEAAFVLNSQGLPSSAMKLKIASTDLLAPREQINISVLASATRYFNHLEMDESTVTKTTKNLQKGLAEATFLTLLPENLKKYYPEVLETFHLGETNGYRMRRFAMLDLSRLLIHNALTKSQWQELFSSLNEYFSVVPEKKLTAEEVRRSLTSIFIEKLRQRVTDYKNQKLFDRVAALSEKLTALLEKEIQAYQGDTLHFSHGDLCFSNILTDRENIKDLKLVDPRGAMTLKEAFLPLEYDFAKLSHCVNGKYDWILANSLKTDFQNELHQNLKKELSQIANDRRINLKLMYLGEASLFLSMLPLHLDQMHTHAAMIASAENAIKNYQDLSHGN
jgi:hypothetical protein